MGSETRADTVVFLGLILAVHQNIDKFNIPELLMIGLSYAVVLCLSLTHFQIKNELQYRNKDLGIPCCLLLPLISIISSANDDGKLTHNLFYIGLVLTSMIPLFSHRVNGKHCVTYLRLVPLFGFVIASLFWVLLLSVKMDVLESTIILLSLFFLWFMLTLIPGHLPKSFTFGELATLSQGLTCFLFHSVIGSSSSVWPSSQTSEYSTRDLVTFSQVAGISCALFIVIISSSSWFKRNLLRIVILLAFQSILLAYPTLIWNLSRDPIVWIADIIFKSKASIFLIIYWFLCVLAAILLTVGYNSGSSPSSDKKSSKRSEKTKIRKLFHLLVTLVYLPGVLLDPVLLHVASVVAMAMMIVVESLRFFNVPPVGKPIGQSFSVFLDDQDGGSVVLTPIYLLVGCSSSLWLSIGRELPKIIPLLGVLSLGVGDSAASYFGSKYGRHHWKDSPKTVEGTLASIISQIMFVALLHLGGFKVLGTISIFRFLSAVVLTSLFESFTSQIDNLLLPLFACLLLF